MAARVDASEKTNAERILQESISVRALSHNESSKGPSPKPQRVEFNDRSCVTFDRRAGVCRPLHECYPYTRAHQTLGNLETWVIGTLGTCNYVEPQGRQVSRASSVPVQAINRVVTHRYMECAACRLNQKTAHGNWWKRTRLRQRPTSPMLYRVLSEGRPRTKGNTRSWYCETVLTQK